MAAKDVWKGMFRKQVQPQQTTPQAVGQEIGFTGTKIFGGLPMEEYNQDLSFPYSTKVYDEMRRSDGQISAVYNAITLPIRSTKWYIAKDEDADDEGLAEDIADFIEDNLFGGMKFSWDDHLREALLMVIFGFSVFEKVHKVDVYNGKQMIVLDKYAPRVAPSIWRFPQDPETYDILVVEQINYVTGQMKSIPIDKCRIYTYQREGDNIVGISAFRPAYKHWYIKTALERIISVGVEKNIVGTPFAYVPKGTSEEETSKVLALLANIRAAEDAGFTVPDDFKVDHLDSAGSGGVQNLAMAFLEHNNTQISKSVLAQFIDLGTLSSASGGSYALGQTMVDLFCMSLDSIATYIEGEVQKDIEELVEWNFGPDAPVPTIMHKPISFNDMSKVAQALYWLGAGHLVTPDVEMEDYIRDLFGIPPISENAITSKLLLPPDRYNPDIIPDSKLTPEEQIAVQIRQQAGQQKDNNNTDGTAQGQASGSVNRATMSETQDNQNTQKKRDLTDAEKRVDFDKIKQQWDEAEQNFEDSLRQVMQQAGTQYINKIENILNNKALSQAQKIQQVQALNMPLQPKYTDAIVQQINAAYQMGQAQVVAELGATSAQVSKPTVDSALIQAKAAELATLQLQRLSSAINLSALGMIQRDMATKEIMYGIKQTAAGFYSDDPNKRGPELKQSGMVTIAEAFHVGRSTAAKQIGIIGAQWSAVMDNRTCPLCAELDGKVISVDNPDFDVFRPPLHFGDRCLLAYLTNENTGHTFDWETPPAALVKKYGGLVNQ